MKPDDDIKRDVEDELRWDPDIDASDIGVAVKHGVVTLSGFVPGYSHKWQAERDAKRVEGVLGVANDLEVRVPTALQKSDPELAREAVAELKSELPYSHNLVKVMVSNGWVALEGDVEWHYQKERAEAAVRRVEGIKGISNFTRLGALLGRTRGGGACRVARPLASETCRTESRPVHESVENVKARLRGEVMSGS